MSSVKVLSAILVGLCGFVAACSTPGRSYTDSKLVETLEVEIMPNTSKMFVYRLRMPEEHMPNNVHVERGGFGGGDGARGGISVGSSTSARLLENADYVVKHMGYCREGFLTIDSSVSQYNLWMKGECKEGATEDDKKKFGTKQILPVNLKP
jgi:hypothetical protein